MNNFFFSFLPKQSLKPVIDTFFVAVHLFKQLNKACSICSNFCHVIICYTQSENRIEDILCLIVLVYYLWRKKWNLEENHDQTCWTPSIYVKRRADGSKAFIVQALTTVMMKMVKWSNLKAFILAFCSKWHFFRHKLSLKNKHEHFKHKFFTS